MSECIGNNFILNGELQPTEVFDNALVYEGNSIYEVIRIFSGRPLFFSDHFERLTMSALLQKKPMLSSMEDLRKDITLLIKSEKQKEINLKIVFNYNESSNYVVYLIKSIYPTKEQYRKGVKGTLFHAERKEPESKVINHRLRSEIYNKLLLESAYEAILVKNDGTITEGSRSNIFLIKENTLFSAPNEEVLNGITRKCIINICRELGIEIQFTLIKVDTLKNYDTVFMTGTSPVVLPFSSIDNINFKVNHPFINLLRETYFDRAGKSLF
jgi:branched-chain amino acid aminotransferase